LAKLSATFVKSYSEGSEFAASGKDFEVTSCDKGVTHASSQVLDLAITINRLQEKLLNRNMNWRLDKLLPSLRILLLSLDQRFDAVRYCWIVIIAWR
jgi:hypothetical protein